MHHTKIRNATLAVLVLIGAALSVTAVSAAPAIRDRFQERDPVGEVNAFCANPERLHPVGARLAARYDVTYKQVMDWFCEGIGFGQIMLALQTARQINVEPATLLDRRLAGEGWGEIWQDAGLIGQGRKLREEDGGPPPWAGPPDERDPDAEMPGGGPPPWAGPPDERDPDAEKPGGGPPPWAGPSDERDPDAEMPGDGPPPWAGPPDERDPDAEKPGGGPPPWAGPPGLRDPDAGRPGRGPKKP
jgi:hypothetical protein